MKILFNDANLARLGDGSYTDARIPGLRYVIKGNRKYRTFYYRRMVSGKSYNITIGKSKLADAKKFALNLLSLTDEEFLAELGKEKLPHPSDSNRLFRDVIDEFIQFKARTGDWSSKRTVDNSYSRIKNHALPFFGDKELSEITPSDVARIAEGDWGTTKTKNRLIGIVKECLYWSKAQGWLKGDNPAETNGVLKYLLPRPKQDAINRGALRLERVPEFYQTLRYSKGMGAKCLAFSILTATRSATVRSMRWEDVSFKDKVWIIPSKNLKRKENGRLFVPLCDKVIEFLQKLGPKPSGFVFIGYRGQMFSDNEFGKIIKDLNKIVQVPFIDEDQSDRVGKPVRATQHGIARACFKTWATNDENGNDEKYSDKISELALHHKTKDAYNGAYERNSYFKKRCELMAEWADFVLQDVEPAALKPGITI